MNHDASQNLRVVERLAEKVLAWQETLPARPIEPAAGKDDYPWPRQARPPRPRPLRTQTPAK